MGGSKIDLVQLQDRDIALLGGLFECRVMTPMHVASLFFDGKAEYAKKRLQKLEAAGYIGRRKRNVNEPSVIFLARKGFILLASGGHLQGYPALGKNAFEARANVSDRTLDHELEVMDVKVGFHTKLKESSKFSVHRFHTWPRLYEFTVARDGFAREVPVKPDGFVTFREKIEGANDDAHDFFLEVDRSHEKVDLLVEKAVNYLEFYKTGGFAVRNGGTREEIEKFPFRVLMIFKTAERRNNIAERLILNAPFISSHTWLATFEEALADPLGAIWIQPKHYRAVTRGTPFDAESTLRPFAYRRQQEREMFVEHNVQKSRLFED